MKILRLKEILDSKNITGKKLANELSVTEATISNLVKGESIPRKDLLLRIAEYLNVDLRDMFVSTLQNQDLETIYKKNDEGGFEEIGYLLKK